MSKQEARAKIMGLLKWYKGLEDQDMEMFEFILSQGGSLRDDQAKEKKFGRYFPLKDLKETIADAMEMKMVKWSEDNENELVGTHDICTGYRRLDRRTVRAHYELYGFTKKDHCVIETVISRMAEQGFIKVSKTGKGFRVMKSED